MIKQVVVLTLIALVSDVAAQTGPDAGREPADSELRPNRVGHRSTNQVEEIVVRARKRDEFLQDTPVSVTALSEEMLMSVGAIRLDDIQALVPNLTFAIPDDGAAVDIRIRGIGTPQIVSTSFDPGVGVYVDGVYLPRTIGTLVDVIDIQQIEVLRGPQGTLFGKNTVGGAINITTRKPQEELEGFLLVRPGNYSSVHSRAMLNIPIPWGALEDKVFTRFSIAQTYNEGYVKNTFRDERMSNDNSLSFLGSVRFLPVDDVTLDLSGTWSRIHTKGRGGECEVVSDESDFGSAEFSQACRETSAFENSADEPSLVDVESYGAWGTASWDAGEIGMLDDVVVKTIGSWREQKPRIRLDVDMTRINGIIRSTAGGAPGLGEPGHQTQFSAETQVNASTWDDRVDFVSGLFGFWEEANETVALGVGAIDAYVDNTRNIDNWTWALYGQASAKLTEWASLTAGLRYTQDKKGIFAKTQLSIAPESPSSTDSEVFSAWTPMASLALFTPDEWIEATPLEHLMAYFTYSRGFRGGGFNGLVLATDITQFEPEYLDSFEVGFKAIAFDQRMTFNVSAFLGKYEGIQVTAIRDLGDPDGDGIPNFDQTTLNAANATTHGAEIEFLALPFDGARLNGSVGLLDTEYDDFPNGVSDLDSSEVDRSGQSFNNAPEFQAHLGVQYSYELAFGEADWLHGWLTPRLDWSYQSDVHLRGPEVGASVQRGYNLLDGRLSYAFNDDRTQLALWSKNLTDQRYFQNVTPIVSSFGVATRFYGAPRTFGGEISHRFN